MRFHHFSSLGFAVSLFALVPACSGTGGQTGDLSGQNDGNGTETGSSGCEEHKQKLSGFDEETDFGTAEQVMAYAEKSFEAPISWKEAPEGQVWSAGPESGVGALHVDVARGDSAYLLTYTAKPNDSGLEIGTICPPPQLGVDVHVSVATDGGALAESYDTLLRTSAPGVASISVPFDLTKLGGSFAVSTSMPGAKLVQLSLDATFMEAGMSGSIRGLQQIDTGGATSASSASGAVLAVWPESAACQALFNDGAGLGMPLDSTALGATGTDTLASVAVAEPTPFTWLDGTASKLTVAIESTGDGCFRVLDLPVEIGGGAGVTYPVTIGVKTEDGRLDGEYTGQVVVTGSGTERQVIASAYLDLSVDQVAESGFADVTVPSGSDALRLRFESQLEGGVATGKVELFAVDQPPCVTNPQPPMSTPGGGMSTPGCQGESLTKLEVASWSN
jgi:hypothetical protein